MCKKNRETITRQGRMCGGVRLAKTRQRTQRISERLTRYDSLQVISLRPSCEIASNSSLPI